MAIILDLIYWRVTAENVLRDGRMKLLARRPEIVFYLMAGYCLLSITLRILRQESLEIDESEQAYLSQYLFAGYGTQPPFYNWVQYIFSGLFGISVATLTVVKNGLLFLAFIFYGLAARTIISDRSLSMITMLGMLTLPPIFLLVQRDLSHTVAALFTVSLFLFGFLQTLKSPRLVSYLITGLAVGLGVISKYNFVIIPVAAIIAILPEPGLHNRLFDWRIIPALALAALIAAPHAYWVVNNLAVASGGTISEMKEGAETSALPHALQGLLSLGLALIKSIAIPTAVFGLVFYGDLDKIARARSKWTRIIGRMLAVCFMIVALIVVGLAATHIREKWLVLFVVLLPLYLATKIDAAGVDAASRLPRFLGIVAVLAVGVVLMLCVSVLVAPKIGRYSFGHTPYDGFVQRVLADHDTKPASVVVDDRILAGNLKVTLPDTPVFLPNFPSVQTPLPLPPGSILAVWSGKGTDRENLPPRIVELLAKNGVRVDRLKANRLAVPYYAGNEGDAYTFGYSWIERP
ncbi:glycosyltransferase family 39 protein [Pararhizobium sp. BT-229]|uniref:ArnT family glycosyltransferase n=1 Tax=Pararhizobium sp. BT-229 TaxID=2986923 RepID=UPI0021F78E6F|nr:glycosyltransferase family 39 protein [Pararhizobium sp. BT-229]MCV9966694.1 glycosyltransferase family 39 protein [Pararhizobium sp. BT-229]